MREQRPDAVLVSGEGDLYANRQLIAELAVKKRLPTICPYRDYVEAGALMGYALDLSELFRRMADDVHKILKGAKPGDIPIYQADQIRAPDQPEDGKSIRPDPAPGAARPRRRGDRIEMLFAAVHEFAPVQVFGRRRDALSTRCGGRRPKSAKARNRVGR